VQPLLGHSKLESTVRYLGIEVDDALEISEQTEIWARAGPPDLRSMQRPPDGLRRHKREDCAASQPAQGVRL